MRPRRRLKRRRARSILKRELLRALRLLRRPWYYAQETRRRALAAERRKVWRRTTTAPCPTAAALLAAWSVRKESKAAMIHLGGLLQDLACYVDSSLRYDETGTVIGRNGGIRGWLGENVPELVPKYKTLMRYKAMVVKLRQAVGLTDPTPTEVLLEAGAQQADNRAGEEQRAEVQQSRDGRRRTDVARTGSGRRCGDLRGKEMRENYMRKILGEGERTFASLLRRIEMAVGVERVGYE